MLINVCAFNKVESVTQVYIQSTRKMRKRNFIVTLLEQKGLSLIIRNSIECEIPESLPERTVRALELVLSYGRMYLPFGQRRICICAGTLHTRSLVIYKVFS